MVTPAWFYSTIAQASAAIIGLTIAFTVSTHLSRRERRRRRTDKAREEAIELKQKYQPLMDALARSVSDSSDLDPENTRYELGDVSSVESWASDKSAPISARIWALTSGISHILSNFSLLSSEPARDQIETMQNAIQELEYSLLYRDNGNDRTLYTEITGQAAENADGFYYHDDILENAESISAWLDRNRRTRDENIAGARPSDLTGENIFSLATISEMFEADLDEFGVKSVESDLTADFLQQNFGTYVLSTSTKLTVTGIFLPVLLLISPPNLSSPVWAVEATPDLILDVVDILQILFDPIAQVAIFSASAYYTVRLFTIMKIDMNTTVPTMGELLGVDSNDETDDGSNTDSDEDSLTKLQFVIQWIQFHSLPDDLRSKITETES